MPIFQRKTDDEKEEARQLKEAEASRKQLEQERDAFMSSPAGLARAAFSDGGQVFQCEIEVQGTKAVVIAMAGAHTRTTKATTDPTAILDSVCQEGWEIVNGSFVFIELGSESRDKFMASGQNIAVTGTVIGYYVFRRCEANKRQVSTMRWEGELPGRH